MRTTLRHERQVLSDLSVEQIEQALQWLDNPLECPPPPELESLNQLDWFLLDKLLQQLQLEREHNSLH